MGHFQTIHMFAHILIKKIAYGKPAKAVSVTIFYWLQLHGNHEDKMLRRLNTTLVDLSQL